MTPRLTYARAREILDYDAETGVLTSKIYSGRLSIGKEVGTLRADGYRRAMLDGERHYVHRVIILWVTGEWPSHEVDHINGNRSDNRFCNFRLATDEENCQNRKLYKTNTTGYFGVSFIRSIGKFRASIGHKNKTYIIGDFKSAEDAAEAYKRRKAQLHTFQPYLRDSA
jgi:hypothetical protein